MRKPLVTKFLIEPEQTAYQTLAKVDVIYAIGTCVCLSHTAQNSVAHWRCCETLFPQVPTRNQRLSERIYKYVSQTPLSHQVYIYYGIRLLFAAVINDKYLLLSQPP